MKNCVFCKIIKTGKPHHEIIWQDKKFIAFLSKEPIKQGHTLLIPRKHVDKYLDMNDKDFLEIAKVAKKMATALRDIFKSKRTAFIIDGFRVPHLHVHLIPVNKSGEIIKGVGYKLKEHELEHVGAMLRSYFKKFK